jgi:hypothetical protein
MIAAACQRKCLADRILIYKIESKNSAALKEDSAFDGGQINHAEREKEREREGEKRKR